MTWFDTKLISAKRLSSFAQNGNGIFYFILKKTKTKVR